MKSPSILLTIADDQRGPALNCLGQEHLATPCLDALAARGVNCTRTYHYGSCHGAVSAPSRAMLHTGRPYHQLDPALLGATYAPPGRTVQVPPTLGRQLRAAGYHCFATGKWHNGVDSFHASFDSGANLFFGGMADHWFTPVRDFDPTGLYPREKVRTASGFSTEVFAQSAIDFIHSRRGVKEPFFCYCAFTAPHDPRTPPDPYRRMYDPRRIELPPNFVPRHPFDNGEMEIRDECLLGWPRDPDEIRRSLAEYYGMISHMDAWIGRIHQALADIGQLENTIVVHTADHGLAVGQHGLMGKQNLYEHSVRTPLILAGPGLPAGATRAGLCYQHDLFPTLLELAGAEVPAEVDFFRSLRPMIGGQGSGRPHLVSHYRDVQRMVRDDRHKLIEYQVHGARREQLFDLTSDPWETCDLASNSASSDRLADLRRLLPGAHLPLKP